MVSLLILLALFASSPLRCLPKMKRITQLLMLLLADRSVRYLQSMCCPRPFCNW